MTTSYSTDCLRESGFRVTPPRRAVLQVLEEKAGRTTPMEVLERGRKIWPSLSRATVYRTLDLLTELGIVRPVYATDGSLGFVCVRRGCHQLICLNCGTAIPFDRCAVEELQPTLAQEFHFQVKSHLLELYGLCEACQESSKKKEGAEEQ